MATTRPANPTLFDITDASAPVDEPLLEPPKAARPVPGRRGRPVTIRCAWCGITAPVPSRGRIPTWCSDTCRHRAWEQRRAAASGRCAVELVEREVEVVRIERVVEPVRVEVPVDRQLATVADCAELLSELASRLDTGRIYDRDIASLRPAMTDLVAAFNRRSR